MSTTSNALAPTWRSYLTNHRDNDEKNKLSVKFSQLLKNNVELDDRLRNVTMDHNNVMIAPDGTGNMVVFHSVANVGQTMLQIDPKIVALVGMESLAMPLIIDKSSLLRAYNGATPTLEAISACSTTTELNELTTAPNTRNASSTNNSSGGLLLAPWLTKAFLNAGTQDPYALIKIVDRAREEFIQLHQEDEELVNDVNNYTGDVTRYLWACGHGDVAEVITSFRPSDRDTTNHLDRRQRECIVSPNLSNTNSLPNDRTVMRHLSSSISAQAEETRQSNELRRIELDRQKEREDKKTNSFLRLHSTIQSMFLNAASKDGDRPSASLPKDAESYFQCSTDGGALQDLNFSLIKRECDEVTLNEGANSSIRAGCLLWSNSYTPSNFSPFSLKITNPGETSQTQALYLHMKQSNNVETTEREIRRLTKQTFVVPTNYESFEQHFRGFGALSDIFFGDGSAPTEALVNLYEKLCSGSGRSVVRQLIKQDNYMAAKILFSIDVRCQRFLNSCMEPIDRADVDESALNFNQLANDILNRTFSIDLPSSFVVAQSNPQDEQRKLGGRKRDAEKISDEDRRIINSNQLDEFKLLQDETWKDIRGQCVREKPKWNANGSGRTLMCARWLTQGYCFDDCVNACSHVPGSELTSKQKSDYKAWLEKVRSSR